MRKYYEAYDDRYRQVHHFGISWASGNPTPIVSDVAERYGIRKNASALEVGCGEGRDAVPLLEKGYNLLATDISAEAISWCRERFLEYARQFQVLDCLNGRMNKKFDFIYAVAVLHMLVETEDRRKFFGFFREQLAQDGIGLICTMGDGKTEMASDVSGAFDLQQRTHQETGKRMTIAATSCRMVSEDTFRAELGENGLQVLELGMTQAPPDFSQLIYAVVQRSA